MTGRAGSIEVLDRPTCLALLSGSTVGRFAVAARDEAPLIVPVNFVLDGEAVVFRTDIGTKFELLHRACSFEIDGIDADRRVGWSVLVSGFAYEATAWEVRHLALEPWAGGDKRHWIRIVPTTISGRRLRLPDPATDADGPAYV